jgi:hypothetical protein
MRTISIVATVVAVSLFFLVLLTCNQPTDPFDVSQAKVSLILKSSDGQRSSSSITDTVGNTDSIGVIIYLTQHFDSTTIVVTSGTTREFQFSLGKRSRPIDTVFYPVTFSFSGDRTVITTGYIKDGILNREAKGTIHIVDRPEQNRKPELTISGTRTVVAGDTVVLSVTAQDPDPGQTVSIEAARLPDGATFEADTFRWVTTLAHVGTDTAVFIAGDNGNPVMTDIDSVFITVSATPVNRPPEWDPKTAPLSGQPGEPITLSLADKCDDPDGDALTYALLDGNPDGDTVVDSTWSFTPTADDIGQYTVRIVASDPDGASDTLTITLTIAASADTTRPVMHHITPAEDSQVVSSSSFQVMVSCTDENGIASVKCKMGADTFSVSRSSDTLYSATVTGLSASAWDMVRFIAIDSSAAANSCTLYVYLRYDPAIPDNVPPVITLVSPATDTVIDVDSFVVTAVCTDQSGIASLTGLRDATPFTMKKSATVDSVWTGTVKGLPSGAYATIRLIATDSSTAGNRDTVSVRIKYDGDVSGPTITRVTPVNDSVATNSASYTVTLRCTDASGVRSVIGVKGTSNFTGTRGSGNNWIITATALTVDVYNAVVFTVTDSSLRANTTKDTLYIKYDPTLLDTIGPTINPKSGPASGSTVANPAIEIIDTIGDPSAIDSAYWTRNNGAKKYLSSVSGKTDWYSLKDTLNEGRFDTLVVTAVDKATRRNRSTQTVILRYIKAPAISGSGQPVSKTVCSGSQAIFSVTATGTAPLSYQWRTGTAAPFNNIGGNFPQCTLSNATATTILSCVVSNGASTSATSNLCTLSVNATPSKPTAVATPAAICSGSQATLSVQAGTGNPGTGGSFKWYTPKTSTQALTSLQISPTTDTWYYVRAEGGPCGNSDWDSVKVTVNQPAGKPTGKAEPTSVCLGDAVDLSVTAGNPGTGGSWVWYASNQTTKITSPVTPTAAGTSTYYVRSENAVCGTPGAWSSAITVTVRSLSKDPTSISATPGTSICPGGGTVTLTVNGGSLGTGASWKWYSDENCTNPAGSGNPLLATDPQTYWVRAEGSCNTTNTVSKTISLQPLTLTPDPPYGHTCLSSNARVSVTPSCETKSIKWYYNPFGISGDDRLITSEMSEFVMMGNTLICNMIAGSDVHCVVTDQAGRTTTSGTWNWQTSYCH